MSACGLLSFPCAAQISVVKTDSLNDTGTKTDYTLSFDASNGGNPVDKLIVSVGAEATNLSVQISGVTYNGVALNLIPNTGGTGLARNRGIWYLDTPFSGGAADIVVSLNSALLGHMRLGVASISGSAPGVAIANFANSAASVSLNVPVADSFVFAAYAGNENTASSAKSPLVEIYAVGGDSANMAAGYEESVAAGLATYSFISTTSPQTSAAAFVPASAAPVLISTTPADNATQAPVAANLVATFSEPVVAATGNIIRGQTRFLPLEAQDGP